jgi:hypothetical protein
MNLPMQLFSEVDRDLRARQLLRSESMVLESSISFFKRGLFLLPAAIAPGGRDPPSAVLGWWSSPCVIGS